MTEPTAAPILVTLEDVRAAQERLRGVATRTPLLPFPTISSAYLKVESLQPTGAFKLRGAYNALAQLSPYQLGRGVVTHSSGNHGHALAYAARLLGARAVVVMPENAPRAKVAHVLGLDVEIVTVGPSHEERVARAHQLAEVQGLELVSSADDTRVIAGQGTAGLEIIEQLLELTSASEDQAGPTVLVPIGAGGLAAGVSTAIKSLRPEARVIGVEPVLAADAHDSLAAGKVVAWSSADVGRTMADGLRIESVGPIAFAHLRRYLDDVLTVEEDEIGEAVVRAAAEARLVLEPSGAVSLAALIRYGPSLADRPLVALLSGGNVDLERYAEMIRRYHRA